MKKINFKKFYVVINLLNMSVNVTTRKSKVAEIVNISRNTIQTTNDPQFFNNFAIYTVVEV